MTKAHTSVEINNLFAERRSPRSLDETAVVTNDDLVAMLEAARWAPSAFNHQPWRFIVGLRGTTVVPRSLSWPAIVHWCRHGRRAYYRRGRDLF